MSTMIEAYMKWKREYPHEVGSAALPAWNSATLAERARCIDIIKRLALPDHCRDVMILEIESGE